MNDNPTPETQPPTTERSGYTATFQDGPAQGETVESAVGSPPPYRYYCSFKEADRDFWRWDNDGGGPIPFDDPDIDVFVYGLISSARYAGENHAVYAESRLPSKAEPQQPDG